MLRYNPPVGYINDPARQPTAAGVLDRRTAVFASGAPRRLATRLEDSIGLWSWYSFGYWTSTQLYPITQEIWWLNQYLPRCLCCALLSALLCAGFVAGPGARPRPRSPKTRGVSVAVLDWTATAASVAALAILLTTPYSSDTVAAFVVAVSLTGLQNAWNMVRWGSVYAASSARENLVRVLVAIVVIACLKMLTLFIPPVAVGVLFGAMLAWTQVAAMKTAGRVPYAAPTAQTGQAPALEAAPRRPERLDMRTLLTLWQTPLSVAVFFAVWSLLNMLLVTNIGHITDGGSGIAWAAVVTQCVDIGFAALLLAWIRRTPAGTIDWSFFWQMAFFVLAMGLLSMSLFGATRVAQVFVSASAVLVFMFTEYLLIQIGRRTPFSAGTAVGAGFAVISLIDWAVRGAIVLKEFDIEDVRLVPVLLFVILLTIVFFLPARSPGMQLLTTELSERERAGTGGIEQRCGKVAASYGLASREAEVLVFLARGRSIPYIAETLYITENTAKTYRQRIYAKLGTHSKQELLDLVEATEP